MALLEMNQYNGSTMDNKHCYWLKLTSQYLLSGICVPRLPLRTITAVIRVEGNATFTPFGICTPYNNYLG